MEPDHLEDVRGAMCLPKAQNFQQTILLCVYEPLYFAQDERPHLDDPCLPSRLYLLCDLATLAIDCALCNKIDIEQNKLCATCSILFACLCGDLRPCDSMSAPEPNLASDAWPLAF